MHSCEFQKVMNAGGTECCHLHSVPPAFTRIPATRIHKGDSCAFMCIHASLHSRAFTSLSDITCIQCHLHSPAFTFVTCIHYLPHSHAFNAMYSACIHTHSIFAVPCIQIIPCIQSHMNSDAFVCIQSHTNSEAFTGIHEHPWAFTGIHGHSWEFTAFTRIPIHLQRE